MLPVLLATCAELPAGDPDDRSLAAALDELGVETAFAVWDDPGVDWSRAVTVLRSTWDYTRSRERFLAWVRDVPALANPAALVAWSSDKTYLLDLAAVGLPVTPTAVAGPGGAVQPPGTPEFVVKPSVGAGSLGAGRFRREQVAEASAHAARLQAAGRTALVQPYVATVDTAGETALVYVAGEFSHAVRKGPMLPAGTAHPLEADDLYVEEVITARTPTAADLDVGRAVLDAVRARSGVVPLYARVDVLPGADGPVLLELELVEPSLFLGTAPGAAARLAAAVARLART